MAEADRDDVGQAKLPSLSSLFKAPDGNALLCFSPSIAVRLLQFNGLNRTFAVS